VTVIFYEKLRHVAVPAGKLIGRLETKRASFQRCKDEVVTDN
jgi:hypothetical protein